MTEEDKKAIERCKELIKTEHSGWIGITNQLAIETVIKKYEEQQSELEKKDKQINELEDIFYNYQLCEYELTDCTYRKCEYITDDEIPPCKECIKQYFERKEKR